ncbi:class II glutamine amidotransferase [Thalassotalea litorea]|uniref:Class II glutamine amidotransferase n=1 Tax=Thalassotalea litorea TaxID=2020715 RepID=A0A5R9IJ63_9GAMM|nr:class II glutamine amidotransferase [Thalassotalea litorea]TLU61327.1 class II glutamine amidotransferase [Thalassotalea litorea]
MCELLAMSANVPTDIVFSFSGLIERGGKTGPHKDGWGITFYEGKGCRTFRDPLPSATSRVARLVKEYPIKSEAVICHIRQANVGKVSLENTHPFVRQLWGRNITFAHNGQLKDYQDALETSWHEAVGESDSEQIFCFILEQLMNKFGREKPQTEELFKTLTALCQTINQYGVFNTILSDGEFVFCYCDTKLHWITRRAPFGPAKLIDTEMLVDFKEETTPNDVVTIIATQPLTDDESWQKMAKGEAILFKLGEVIEQHTNN